MSVGRLATASAALTVALPAYATFILNGDFENNTSGVTCNSNLSNVRFSMLMSDVTAFGTASEIDVYKAACFGPLGPQSGQTKIAINNQLADQNAPFDAFSFSLSSPVVAGNLYTLSLWVHSVPSPDFGPLQVGVSTSDRSLGTVVFTSGTPSTTTWTQFQTTFMAPITASFLTVRNQPGFEVWNHIDNFSLSLAPEPFTLLLLGAGVAGVGAWRRREQPGGNEARPLGTRASGRGESRRLQR